MIAYNLNWNVRIKLTKRGKEILRTTKQPGLDYKLKRDYYTDQLWQIANIFGKYMELGMNNVVETTIELLFPEEEE